MAITSTRDDRTEEVADELRRMTERHRILRRRLPSLAAAAALYIASGAAPATPQNTTSEGRKKGHMA